MKTFENFDIIPTSATVKTRVSVSRQEDGQINIHLHQTKKDALKSIDESDLNQYVYEDEFKMTMIGDQFYMTGGSLYDGGWEDPNY